jgi:hypothetical protein
MASHQHLAYRSAPRRPGGAACGLTARVGLVAREAAERDRPASDTVTHIRVAEPTCAKPRQTPTIRP